MSIWITEVADPSSGPRLAVKDNVDVAGLPTTCAHPSFAHLPGATAPAVQALIDAGYAVVGKTNLDQFATGLVGTRSPYGAVANPFVPDRIAGGSSSGSAAAVALGLADVAIGTDTAGSGRVPAALCGIVGLKPTVGLISTVGVVPACESLDCVSVFAPTMAGAAEALSIMARSIMATAGDRSVPTGTPVVPSGALRIGVPRPDQLIDLDELALAAWQAALKELAALGPVVELDVTAYLEAGQLVYGPAYLPERYAAVGEFLATHDDGTDANVASIIGRGGTMSAAESLAQRLTVTGLRGRVEQWWRQVDVVAVPTTGFAPTLDEVARDPIELNNRLGTWTAGANPLGLCAAAVPCGTRDDGVPFGVTFLGPAFADPVVAAAGARLLDEPDPAPPGWVGWTDIVVVGAHLEGQPLNWQLTERGAHLERVVRTSPRYRLFALPTEPPKPGLVRVGDAGASIEAEMWRLPTDGFGSFVAAIPAPLVIGTVELDDGTAAAGFLCESIATSGAPDITDFGGWRAYLAR